MKSGIYQIKNLINDKVYLGSTNNFNRRKLDHYRALLKNKHPNKKLQRSFNKYGKENFIFEILAVCPIEYCIKLEQWFINTVRPKYNILLTAGNCLNYKHSTESKQKISAANKGRKVSEETRAKQSLQRKGRKLSIETIEKLRTRNKGRKKSQESIDKTANSHKRKVYQYSLSGGFIKMFYSVKEASKELNISPSNIANCCRGIYKQSKGFMFKYEFYDNILSFSKKEKKHKPVIGISENNQIEFSSVKQASETLHMSPKSLYTVICNKEKLKGFYWRYK